MVPPAVSAVDRAASVQDAGVPVPMTAVGEDVLTAEMGAMHTAGGGVMAPPSTLGGGALASGGVAPSPEAAPPLSVPLVGPLSVPLVGPLSVPLAGPLSAPGVGPPSCPPMTLPSGVVVDPSGERPASVACPWVALFDPHATRVASASCVNTRREAGARLMVL